MDKNNENKKNLEFNFELVDTGPGNLLELVPSKLSTRSEKLKVPPLLFPYGMPPIEKDLGEKLREDLLKTTENYINDFTRHFIKDLPREINYSSLYCHEPSSIPTTLKVDRDPITGEMTGYHEELVEVAESSCNSLGFTRTPNQPNQSLRGNKTNFPFWPGGMSENELKVIVNDTENISLGEDLLTCPPGFKSGVNFKKEDNKDEEKVRNIDDILAEFQIDDVNMVNENDENEGNQEMEVVSEVSNKSEDAEVDNLLPNTSSNVEVEKPKKEVEIKQWAVEVDVTQKMDDFHQKVPNMAKKYPFELDKFQKQAVLRLERSESVFVAAHTSAGKTVVAEYAIALAFKHMTKVIYTSPIKALSNQKFRDFKKTFADVGLVTGDIQLNPKASCLIMTTEILKSMLYNGSDVIRDLEWVIFDEVHYINDSERGVVWEEVLIMLPERCNVVMLSATTPNHMEFANWVGKIKHKKIYVIKTLKRPVPLVHHLYTGKCSKTSNEMFVILDSKKQLSVTGYRQAVQAKEKRKSQFSKSFGSKKTGRGGSSAAERNVWLSLINRLKKLDQLPLVAFTLSKKRCDENSNSLISLDLTSQQEKSEIHIFCSKCVNKLKEEDRKLPQVVRMQELLKRGIAVHHSGVLPILKEVVEMLFARGLVKLLFATETFAMGVNMPARSVAFDRLRKHDGTQMRNLLPGEYIQMAGRAGRRGLDVHGNVIILCQGDVPEISELNAMMLGKPMKLNSQFRLTYSMILNLLRVEQLRVEEVMKRSFSEFNNRKDSKEQEKQLKEVQNKVEKLGDLPSNLPNFSDYKEYIQSCTLLLELRKQVIKHSLTTSKASEVMQSGRIIIIKTEKYQNFMAAILKVKTTEHHQIDKISCLVVSHETVQLDGNEAENSCDWDPKTVLGRKSFVPDQKITQEVVQVEVDEIVHITSKTMKVDANMIIRDHQNRQIPRFRDNPPAKETVVAANQLTRLIQQTNEDNENINIDFKKTFNLNSLEVVDQIWKITEIEKKIESEAFSCTQEPMFKLQVAEVAKLVKLEEEADNLRYRLSEESLLLLPEYQQRVKVLKELNYIDASSTIQLKGRVACELANHELVLTELVFHNVFSTMDTCHIVALLSCVVFQQRVDQSVADMNLPQPIKDGIEQIKERCRIIAEMQQLCGMRNASTEDFVNQLKFGLVEVVYQWAMGTSFEKITELTDVQEGIIVRTIQRLNEVCRDVRNAARVIGDDQLFDKMERCSETIKRDIVFAASLYTQ